MTVHSAIQAEAAERAALADLHRAAPAASRERLGMSGVRDNCFAPRGSRWKS